MAIRLDLNLHSGDDAFTPDAAPAELARVLRCMAAAVEKGREGPFTLRDVNGNTCGSAHLEIWDDEASA